MGQEIVSTSFLDADFDCFARRLQAETEQLRNWFGDQRFAGEHYVGGFELEAWITDRNFQPAPVNDRIIKAINSNLVVPELARFNLEINGRPQVLTGNHLQFLHADLSGQWRNCSAVARALDCRLIMAGILPTVRPEQLNLDTMSNQNRYRALNEQVFQQRRGRPLQLDIVGNQSLHLQHPDVMLEAAATSFQIHLQTPLDKAVRCFNAAIVLSGPMVAVSTNAPFLFGKQLWEETRIPLFEQAVEVGGFAGAAQGPIRRVTFGSGYAKASLMEFFDENLQHYPILLPMDLAEDQSRLAHLRLHNGTIWRWNRPLIGFGDDGVPHVRIEHRVVSAGPTVVDELANSALFYGLAHSLSHAKQAPESLLPFSNARDNFYEAARYGLQAQLHWYGDKRISARALLEKELLPLAHEGLQNLGIDDYDRELYLGIIEQRVSSGRTGAWWQRSFVERNGPDMAELTRAYYQQQQTCRPVHQWEV